MNRHLRDMLMAPVLDEARGRSGGRGRDRADMAYDNDYRGKDMAYDNRGGYDSAYDNCYDGGYGYERDERRGVRGSGRRDRGYDNVAMELDSHFEKMKYLKPHQIHEWMEKIGARWRKEQLMPYIEKENIRFEMKDYTEEEFIMTVNMLYSDYKDVLGTDPVIYIKLAKKFLEDKDAIVRGGEKLSSYYYAIAYDGR